MNKEELDPIGFGSELCKAYKLVSIPPMAVYVGKDQPTVYRDVTKEAFLFNQKVDLSGDTLFDFGVLNKSYLNKIGIDDINSLQKYMDEHLIYYNIEKI